MLSQWTQLENWSDIESCNFKTLDTKQLSAMIPEKMKVSPTYSVIHSSEGNAGMGSQAEYDGLSE